MLTIFNYHLKFFNENDQTHDLSISLSIMGILSKSNIR